MSNPIIIDGESSYTRPDFDGADALFRLLIGISLEGFDQFFARLKKLESDVYDPAHFTASEAETQVDQLRYLMLGLSYMGQRRVRRRIQQVNRVTATFAGLVRPLKNRIESNAMVKVGFGMISAEVERVTGEGRLQEQNARHMVRRIFGSSVDEVLHYLSDSQQLSHLLHSETISTFGDELLDRIAEFSNRSTVSLDDTEMLDALAEAILKRLQR